MASQQPLPVLLARDGSEWRIPIVAPPITPYYSSDMGGKKILFLHPGYGSAINVLFSLACVDRASDGTYGIHHRTALTACQIVANNTFNGFLALDKTGQKRVTSQLDDVLMENAYYFVVPDDDHYPIVPSFRDWEFPHMNVPNTWPQPPQAAASARDVCLISKYPWAITDTHMIPSAQVEWFNANNMARYGNSIAPDIDVRENILRLKQDIHHCFDKFMFALVPKPSAPERSVAENESGNVQSNTEAAARATTLAYTVHIINNEQPLFAQLHHDIQLPHIRGVVREYLFARFALAIFMRLKPFVNAGYKRRVARLKVVDEDMGPEVIYEEVDGVELQQQYGGGKSRSASPTKRKRPGTETADYEAGTPELYEGMDDTESSDESMRYGSVEERDYMREMEEEQRGRPRKRKRILCNDFVDAALVDA